MKQPGFFDLNERHKKLNEKDPLTHLNSIIDWEDFRPILMKVRPKNKKKPGRPAFDVVLMFKILILQSSYNLADDKTEFQIRDRYSFCRFLSLMPEDRVPDSKTVWLFREQLTQAKLMKELFHDFDAQLHVKGFVAPKGQIVDASFIEAPKQRNTKKENAAIKAGLTPDDFKDKPNKARQKDTKNHKPNRIFLGDAKVHFGFTSFIVLIAHIKHDYSVCLMFLYHCENLGRVFESKAHYVILILAC